ncbi:MAG TPA: NrfD/PsrC family molybdoenzyme membrane anchor subunit [Actinomycetota bacterium]|nr:NrfD/PsrC family molybdoenzyme membrane anchor subunit [Actinomycetota bacterium]
MTTDDGRNIDERVAVLSGEGSGQKVAAEGREDMESTPVHAVFERPPIESRGTGTYYDRPVLKEPVWKWFIPAYFFAGGAAGAAQVLAAAAQVADRDGLGGLVKRARWIAAAGLAAGTTFLIADLGRPERFMNMLRVFRPTSAMNAGSWILATSGPLAGASALLADRDGWLGRSGDLAGLAAGPAGLPLSAYTAVLLADTSIPIWHQTRRTLPPLFAASSMASAASLLEMMDLSDDEQRVVHRLGKISKTAELLAATAVDIDAARVEQVARPLEEGLSGTLWKVAKAATGASLVLSGGSRRRRKLAAALGVAGSLALRFAVHHAGKRSARDPKATFAAQRAGITRPVRDPSLV